MSSRGKYNEAGLSRLDAELTAHCFDEALADPASAAVASALSVARTGVNYSDDAVERMASELGEVAQLYGLSPDDMQRILFLHEPDLAKEF